MFQYAARFAVSLLIPLVLAIATACDSDESFGPVIAIGTAGTPSVMENPEAPKAIRISVGETAAFEVEKRQYQRFMRYSSNNPDVAAVSTGGAIVGVSPGSATVLASFGTYVVTANVQVAESVYNDPELPLFSIAPRSGAALAVGASRRFWVYTDWSEGELEQQGVIYTATGGTISAMGVYTAGQLAGKFMVIAHCLCGLADTADVTISTTAAQLRELHISPKTVSLDAGATQQFQVRANWTTGDSTVPPISYAATGGVVSSLGRYTAPAAAGTYRVIVSHAGGVLQDTAVVVVARGGGTTPPSSTPPSTPTNPPGTNPKVLFYDSFESGDFATTQNGIGWSSKRWVEISTAIKVSGNNSARFNQGNSGSAGGELRFGGLPQLKEVYIQFFLYQPSGEENPTLGTRVRVPKDGKNDKFFRLWGGRYAEASPKVGASTWGANGVGVIGTEFNRNIGTRMLGMGEGGTPFKQSPKFPFIGSPDYLGRWVRVRIRAKTASLANDDGIIQIWIDDQLASDKTDLPTLPIGGENNYFTSGYLLGWANSGFAPGVNYYMDDVSISIGGFPDGQ